MGTGNVIQIIGAVVDVEFPQNAVPKVYNALEVENGATKLLLEVEQQLGGGVVAASRWVPLTVYVAA